MSVVFPIRRSCVVFTIEATAALREFVKSAPLERLLGQGQLTADQIQKGHIAESFLQFSFADSRTVPSGTLRGIRR